MCSRCASLYNLLPVNFAKNYRVASKKSMKNIWKAELQKTFKKKKTQKTQTHFVCHIDWFNVTIAIKDFGLSMPGQRKAEGYQL